MEDSSDNKIDGICSRFSARIQREWQGFMAEIRRECVSKRKRPPPPEEKDRQLLTKMSRDGDEILNLNVSGEKFAVRRSVFTMVPNSALQTMILNEEKVTKDKDGVIFLDFNPVVFEKILDFMKMKSIETQGKTAPIPIIDEPLKEKFDFLVNSLGLNDLFIEGKTFDVSKSFEKKAEISLPHVLEPMDECFEFRHNKNIEFSENGMVCTSLTEGTKWTLGKNIYSEGIFAFEFEILRLSIGSGVFLGILDSNRMNYDHEISCYAKTAYGWAGKGNVVVNGKFFKEKDGYHENKDLKEKDTIILTLNLEQSTLTFKNMRSLNAYVLMIPAKKKWRIHVNIFVQGDQIRLVRASSVKFI